MPIKPPLIRIGQAILLLATLAGAAQGQRFPDDTFGIFPLYGVYSGSAGSLNDAQALAQVLELKAQIGENKGHFRVGFNGIFGGQSTLQRNCRLAQENNLSHAVIIGVQTHALPSNIKSIAAADFRNYQWRRDGVTWEGVDTTDNRDWQVVTPSRYATALRARFRTNVEEKAIPIREVMAEYPGVIISVNACIEEELALRGQAEAYLADYSPYAITEFRDWLRHTGIYDAETGAYPDEGALAAMVGTFVMIDGKLRSPFYDDPTPADANGTGQSFNTTFGTGFTTWTLRNWDLSAYPAAITDRSFDPTPSSGTGYTAGGFDAPRTRSNSNPFWRAWSWDYADQGDTYPAGHPTAPAFGFRQTMVRNFVNDVLSWIEAVGIPSEIITAHQIPGEMLFSDNRARSAASPIWTGLSKHNGTVGITRYGTFSSHTVGLVTQYTDNWGIFEWHPKPNESNDAALHSLAMSQLDLLYANNCRIVCPFSWTTSGSHSTYPVNNSGFATGIKAWLEAKDVGELTISSLSAQTVSTNTATDALVFTLRHTDHSLETVVLSGTASDPTLVPPENIVFTGSGPDRTVTVTPAPGLTGKATITVTATNDGETDTVSFELTVVDGVFRQIVPLQQWDQPNAWSPSGLPVPGFDYVTRFILRTPSETTTFGGSTLTLEAGADLQIKTTGGAVSTVPHLILAGGKISAGDGFNVLNTLDGLIDVQADAELLGLSHALGDRDLDLRARIIGHGVLTSTAAIEGSTHRLIVRDPTNDFSGTWISARGLIEFANAGAVGRADIVVEANGQLRIHGDWNQAEATLTVADAPNAAVNVGSYHWTVAGLTIGSRPILKGDYALSVLNEMRAASFLGDGMISVTRDPQPRLTVQPVADGLIFSWSADGFRLQMKADDFTAGPWSDVSEGTTSPVSFTMESTTTPNTYFRLVPNES